MYTDNIKRSKNLRYRKPQEEQTNNLQVLYPYLDIIKDPKVKKVGYVVIALGGVYGVMYLSKYFIRAAAKMIYATKDLKNAIRK